jgi:serine/threonine protein kinase
MHAEKHEDRSPSIGEYKIGVLIGEGSFSRVFYGEHKATCRKVALKVVDRVLCVKHRYILNSLRNEQNILRELVDCPFIVTLLSSFVDRHNAYMALECCMHGTLEEWIQWKHTPKGKDVMPGDLAGDVASYGYQILQGLRAIHLKGWIHADLKPSNVLLADMGRTIRIADLGSAISIDGKRDCEDQQWKLSTTDYSSPELLKGQLGICSSSNEIRTGYVTILRMIAVDIWAFGCLIFAAWQGRSPFHAASDALAVDQIMEYARLHSEESRMTWISAIARRAVPGDEWLPMILEFLHPDPDLRFAGCGVQQKVSDIQGFDDIVNALHSEISNRSVWEHRLSDHTSASHEMIPSPKWLVELKRTSLSDATTKAKTMFID